MAENQGYQGNQEEIVAGATKEVVKGLADHQAAPWITIIIFGGFFALITYIISPLLSDYIKAQQAGDRYVIETFNNQLKNTTSTIVKFDETLGSVNTNLSNLQAKIDDTRTEQKSIRQTLNDHEKRIIKLEESK